MSVRRVNAKQTKQMLDSRKFGLIIDLRDYYEFSEGHLMGAINIPINEILDNINRIQRYKGQNVLLYCEHGIKSIGAGKVLILNGFKKVYSLDDGIEGYNYPLSI